MTTGTTRVDGGTETGATNGVDDALTFSGDCSPDMENLDVVTNTLITTSLLGGFCRARKAPQFAE